MRYRPPISVSVRKLESLPIYAVSKRRQYVLLFCHKARVWRTDGQTDGRTELLSQDRASIATSRPKNKVHTFSGILKRTLSNIIWLWYLWQEYTPRNFLTKSCEEKSTPDAQVYFVQVILRHSIVDLNALIRRLEETNSTIMFTSWAYIK